VTSSDVSRLLLAQRSRAAELVAALTAERDDIIESARLVATDDEHDPEGSTIAFERARIEALLQQSATRMAELDRALGRLDAGSYGSCERCGRPIDPERLAARPATSTCIGCG
jgi:RNA polymerase-binding transcription factor DksA